MMKKIGGRKSCWTVPLSNHDPEDFNPNAELSNNSLFPDPQSWPAPPTLPQF